MKKEKRMDESTEEETEEQVPKLTDREIRLKRRRSTMESALEETADESTKDKLSILEQEKEDLNKTPVNLNETLGARLTEILEPLGMEAQKDEKSGKYECDGIIGHRPATAKTADEITEVQLLVKGVTIDQVQNNDNKDAFFFDVLDLEDHKEMINQYIREEGLDIELFAELKEIDSAQGTMPTPTMSPERMKTSEDEQEGIEMQEGTGNFEDYSEISI